MTNAVSNPKSLKQKFSNAFWVANGVELLERLAYYAVFIVITLYLSNVWGFSDIEAGAISGVFSACCIYFHCFRELMPIKLDFVRLSFWLSLY